MTRPRPANIRKVEPSPVTLDDLTDMPSDEDVPYLDRLDPGNLVLLRSEHLDYVRLWRRDGVVVLRGAIPSEVIDHYCAAWGMANDVGRGLCSPEWNEIAYMRAPVVRDLCLLPEVMGVMNALIGSPMALHLNLLNWRSTTRDWHQDDYLNPPYINGHYIAAWYALEEIHPESGPFQYVPGSHRWPVLRRDKVLKALGEDGSNPDWPWRSEQLLSPLYEALLAEQGITPVTYLPERGDVLLWHARLLHRGSRPANPDRERRAAIAHYSAIRYRKDMPTTAIHGTDPSSRFFVLGL